MAISGQQQIYTCLTDAMPASSGDTWHDDLLVGLPVLDDDHKSLLNALKILNSCNGDSMDMLVLGAILLFKEYCDGHLYREEKALQAARYHRIGEFRHKNLIFMAKINAALELYQSGIKSGIREHSALAIKWLHKHILEDHKQFKGWISHANIDARPLGVIANECVRRK